jgi:hypothetical protein
MMAYLASIALRPIELHRAFNRHPRNCHPERSGVSEAQPRGVEGPLHPLPQPDCIQTFSRSALHPRSTPTESARSVLISMQPPTKPMLKEAAEAGFYQVPGLRDKYPRLQILSIADLLDGKRVEYPRFAADTTLKKAPKARKAAEEQMPLGGGEIEEPF